MKKFRFAALMMCFVAMGLMFTSCSKNEDLIIGKWKCVKMVSDGRTFTTPDEETGVGSIWEFKADGSLSMGVSGFAVNGTYTLKDDVLTMTIMGDVQKANIEKLTKSKMILSDPEDSKTTIEFDKQ